MSSDKYKSVQGDTTHMPIVVNFAPSRSEKVAVDVVPADWQTYIAQ